MADRVYHNLTGWHNEDEKHDATHMLLTIEEYDELVSERRSAIAARDKMKSDAQRYKQNADYDAQMAIKTANDKAAAQVEQMKKRMDAAESEAERQTNLNRNLLRITRERANAKRGLQPKRTHSGYRFTGKIMQTKVVAGYDKKTGTTYADVWTATLETPYNATIPINQIRDRIFNDLTGNGETDGILSKLYIKCWYYKDSTVIWKGSYEDAVKDNANNDNYLFDYKFMANPKSGLWEVQITTTKSIRALAEMMA